MAHRPTQRRNHLAPQQSNPSPSSSTVANHPKPTTHRPTPNPDLIRPDSNFMLQQHFSSLNLGPSHNKARAPPHTNQSQITKHKHPSLLVDTRLRAKAMTSSAIVDSSKFSLLKPNTNNTRAIAPKLEKHGGGTKRSSEEKPQKSKLHAGLVKNERKKNKDGYLAGDDDVEIVKSRNHDCDYGGDDVAKRSCFSVSMVAPSGDGIRRRSLYGSSLVDLRDVFAINGVKMVSADMPPFMQIHAVDSARKAVDSMEKFTSKTLASSLKKEFDGVYGPAWHCIVGTSFGSFVTHSVGGFLYFSMDQKLYILLFKTAVQKVN